VADDRDALLARAQLLQKATAIRDTKKLQRESDPQSEAGSPAEAALQGFGQGATLGYLPHLQALAEPAVTKGLDIITGQNQSKDLPGYLERRDQWAKTLEQLQVNNPKSFAGGQVAGGLTSAFIAPQAALSKGASIPLRIGAQVGAGAAIRGAMNPGDTQGAIEPIQYQERISNVASPMAIGIDAAIPLAGPALGYISKKAGAQAERLAFKSLGPYARDSMKAFGNDKVNSIGRTMLNTGVVGGGLPKRYETLANDIAKIRSESGEKLGALVEQMAQKETGKPIGVSRSKVADKLQSELISPEVDAAGVANRNSKMQEYIDQFRRGGSPIGEAGPQIPDDQIPLLQAEMKKRGIANEINWDRLPGADIPDSEAFNRKLLSQLRGEVEAGGEVLANKTGFDVGQFRKLKDEYGNLSAAESIAEKRSAKEYANRLLSPSDYGVGMVGAGVGALIDATPEDRVKHAAMGGVLALANHAARKYGNQVTANGLNNMSILARSAKPAANAIAINPVATQAALNQPGVWNNLYQQNKKDKKK
jgi:hypothetical protein